MQELRFTSGNEDVERVLRTHFFRASFRRTRRAGKYSSRSAAVVVEFRRSRGRYGRTGTAGTALELAVRAYVRHARTDYDELLGRGIDREDARARVRDSVHQTSERMAGTE